MVHARCIFVASIHPSRTWMLGSFESMQWNACVHRLDLGLYSHLKDLGGEWSRKPCLLQGKYPLYQKTFPQRMIEPMTLHQAGQQAQHTTSKLFCHHWLFSVYVGVSLSLSLSLSVCLFVCLTVCLSVCLSVSLSLSLSLSFFLSLSLFLQGSV